MYFTNHNPLSITKMASILQFLAISLFCSFLLVSSSPGSEQIHVEPESHHRSRSHNNPPQQAPNKPNLLILPIQHDGYTGLHWANIHKRTPLMQVPVLLDLNGKHLWVNCDNHYSSSTYQAPYCHSTQCARANTHTCHTCVASSSRPGCHNNTCELMSANPITQQTAIGELAQDVLAMLDISKLPNIGPMVTVPQFLFSCAPSFLAQKGLPSNVQGVAGLGHDPISLPNQLASHFGLQRQFTMCLSRSPSSKGAIVFGNDDDVHKYTLSRRGNNNNNNNNLTFTPLTTTQQGEYRVHVTSIRINQHTVVPAAVSSSVSSYPEGVMGKTVLSTAIPYTIFHHTIYQAFTQAYSKQLPRQAQVKAVAPFGFCFDSKYANKVPSVELVMDRPDVVWRISGENLMVQAQPGVSCLAFVNGGLKTRAAITIGSRQLEESFLQFDIARSTLGFSNSFASHGVMCGDIFDFINARP